ncbi:glyoxalase/bleomycin resistance/extradiol dioxygenase family protein [Taibaiella lutea]|uniref:Glyoxalase/bleomycin resistance/extradiol dioxygenase family protein n=1 Tax=Taibaiella lutea TaxID=2608001 RepID=A0A5M6CQ58_9BACT|nr:VOC family protein [Taibaiella lutea]KAA5537103.1 glyoxalase/bleomycin resistance/extradiol dioxygenase family protein [Taibaiella lutea]
MKPKIFINLPVADLKKSMDFYTQIGFSVNPQFTDETAAAMVFSDEIFVMLLTHEKFSMFTTKPISNAGQHASAIFALEVESPEKMNKMVDSALAAGGREPLEGKDYGFMQQRSMEDPDGHLWEVLFMDMSKFPQQ